MGRTNPTPGIQARPFWTPRASIDRSTPLTPDPNQTTACGLYYAAELAEEYASATKRVIAWAIGLVMALHLALVVEKFPLPLLAGGVGCHAVYACLLLDFPNVEVFSLKFGLSLCEYVRA